MLEFEDSGSAEDGEDSIEPDRSFERYLFTLGLFSIGAGGSASRKDLRS